MNMCQILNGDSRTLSQEITGPIHAIITDPPYGMSHLSGSAETAHGKKFVREIDGDGDLAAAIDLFHLVTIPLLDQCADETEMYVFTRWNMTHQWSEAIDALQDFQVKNVLVWDKGTPGMGDIDANWAFSWEAIIYAKKGRRHIPKRRSSVISIDRTHSAEHFHPTQKPVELLEVLISMSTNPGDLVVDPFAGSGSTIVAAERLGRRGIGIEKDQEWATKAQMRLGQGVFLFE